MSALSVTYQFVDGTDAEAAQVNQNFADVEAIVNGGLDASNLAALAVKAGKLDFWFGSGAGTVGSTGPMAGVHAIPPGTYLVIGSGALGGVTSFAPVSFELQTESGSVTWTPAASGVRPRWEVVDFSQSGITRDYLTVVAVAVVSTTASIRFMASSSGSFGSAAGGLLVFGVKS